MRASHARDERERDRRPVARCDACGGEGVDLTRDGVDEYGAVVCLVCRARRMGFEQGERLAAREALRAYVEHLLSHTPLWEGEIRAIVDEALAGRDAWTPADAGLKHEERELLDAVHGRAGHHAARREGS